MTNPHENPKIEEDRRIHKPHETPTSSDVLAGISLVREQFFFTVIRYAAPPSDNATPDNKKGEKDKRSHAVFVTCLIPGDD